MKRHHLATAAFLASLSTLPAFAEPTAQAPTYTKDVLPILQENCIICHRPGGANLGGMIAPMAFTTYEETRPWAKAIGKAVANGEMPPWMPRPSTRAPLRASAFSAPNKSLPSPNGSTLARARATPKMRRRPSTFPIIMAGPSASPTSFFPCPNPSSCRTISSTIPSTSG